MIKVTRAYCWCLVEDQDGSVAAADIAFLEHVPALPCLVAMAQGALAEITPPVCRVKSENESESDFMQ